MRWLMRLRRWLRINLARDSDQPPDWQQNTTVKTPVEESVRDTALASDDAEAQGPVDFRIYDRRSLSYAGSFDDPWKAWVIRAIELFTGKITILRLIRKFERRGAPRGQPFWRACLDVMGIELTTPQSQLDRIPKEGPVIVVSNHPHGMVDGMIFADLIGRVRPDYRILTRSLLTGIDDVAGAFMIPVPFPHDKEAQRKGVEMRAKAMEYLEAGGVVALFPSGVVASSETWFGPTIEAEWNVFTAKLIRRSGAAVVPMKFPGANSRAYQIANKVSPILRQGLLLHEIVHSLNKPMGPIVGHALDQDDLDKWADDPRGFMAWLRDHTLSLTD